MLYFILSDVVCHIPVTLARLIDINNMLQSHSLGLYVLEPSMADQLVYRHPRRRICVQ